MFILTLRSQYIYEHFHIRNTEVHEINTCKKLDFQLPLVRLTTVQDIYYSSITLFNSPPLNIKQVEHDIDTLKHKLGKFLAEPPFYLVRLSCLE
jgi:hypothetical protein